MTTSVINENGRDFQFESSPQRIRLRQWWTQDKLGVPEASSNASATNLWERSKLLNSDLNFYVEAFEMYKPTVQIKEPRQNLTQYEKLESTLTNTCHFDSKSFENTHITKMCEDFEKLFDSGKRTDLTIFVKSERQIKCHTLVLFARCKSILEEVIEQKLEKGNDEAILLYLGSSISFLYMYLNPNLMSYIIISLQRKYQLCTM